MVQPEDSEILVGGSLCSVGSRPTLLLGHCEVREMYDMPSASASSDADQCMSEEYLLELFVSATKRGKLSPALSSLRRCADEGKLVRGRRVDIAILEKALAKAFV